MKLLGLVLVVMLSGCGSKVTPVYLPQGCGPTTLVEPTYASEEGTLPDRTANVLGNNELRKDYIYKAKADRTKCD